MEVSASVAQVFEVDIAVTVLRFATRVSAAGLLLAGLAGAAFASPDAECEPGSLRHMDAGTVSRCVGGRWLAPSTRGDVNLRVILDYVASSGDNVRLANFTIQALEGARAPAKMTGRRFLHPGCRKEKKSLPAIGDLLDIHIGAKFDGMVSAFLSWRHQELLGWQSAGRKACTRRIPVIDTHAFEGALKVRADAPSIVELPLANSAGMYRLNIVLEQTK